MERIVACLTVKALEEQLKAARKELRAAERRSRLQMFFTALMILRTNKKKTYDTYLLMRYYDLQVYNFKKTLDARKNAMRTYRRYRNGQLEKNHALFAYIQYRYFKDKLTKQR